jgi:hypothetical protein
MLDKYKEQNLVADIPPNSRFSYSTPLAHDTPIHSTGASAPTPVENSSQSQDAPWRKSLEIANKLLSQQRANQVTKKTNSSLAIVGVVLYILFAMGVSVFDAVTNTTDTNTGTQPNTIEIAPVADGPTEYVEVETPCFSVSIPEETQYSDTADLAECRLSFRHGYSVVFEKELFEYAPTITAEDFMGILGYSIDDEFEVDGVRVLANFDDIETRYLFFVGDENLKNYNGRHIVGILFNLSNQYSDSENVNPRVIQSVRIPL